MFAAFGVFLLGLGIVYLAQASASSGWPSTSGTVISCQAKKVHGKRTGRARKKGRSGSRYYVDIQYQYSVDGTKYVGDKVSLGTVKRTLSQAKQKAAGYPVGTQVDVFYDPAKPSVAILEPGVEISIFTFVVIGAFFILVGVGLAGYRHLKGRLRQR